MSGDAEAITKMREAMKRGAVARLLDCNAETIRYYESVQLIPEPDRTVSGHRLYDTRHIDALRFVLRLRSLGFSIDEIRSLTTMVDSGNYTCGQIARTIEAHLKSIRQKIEDLKKLESALTPLLAQCHRGDTPDCAIIKAL